MEIHHFFDERQALDLLDRPLVRDDRDAIEPAALDLDLHPRRLHTLQIFIRNRQVIFIKQRIPAPIGLAPG